MGDVSQKNHDGLHYKTYGLPDSHDIFYRSRTCSSWHWNRGWIGNLSFMLDGFISACGHI